MSSDEIDPITIEGRWQILALHKFLFAAKFDTEMDDEYVGSPYIANVQRLLADALEHADPGDGWTRWRNAAEHQHRLQRVRRYVASAATSKWWVQATPEERAVHVRDVLAPLRASDDLVADLCREPGDVQQQSTAAEPAERSNPSPQDPL